MGAEPPPDLKHGVLHGVEAVVGRRAPNGLIDLLFCDRNVRVGIEQVEDTKLLFRQGIACIPTTARRPAGSMDSRGEPEIPKRTGRGGNPAGAVPTAGAGCQRADSGGAFGGGAAPPPAGRFPTVKEEKLNGGRAAAGRDMRQAAEAAAAQKDLRGVDAGFRRRLSPVQAQARGGQPASRPSPAPGTAVPYRGMKGASPFALSMGRLREVRFWPGE